MSLKTWVTLFLLIGSIVGGYIPALWGDSSFFSVSGILLSGFGGLIGVWAGYRMYSHFS